MSKNALQQIQQQFSEEILAEACQRFGFLRNSLSQKDGSAFVYEGQLDQRTAILKVTPGFWNMESPILGSTLEQILGELDFVGYLASHGVAVALPLSSRAGNLVELLPISESTCFLAYAFEKISGSMYEDAEEVSFPDRVIRQWGELLGKIHRLSGNYRVLNPSWTRPGWEADDLLDYHSLIPATQPIAWNQYEKMLASLTALPRKPDCFGLIHGDLHHGNFFEFSGELIAFDFDAAHYSWYVNDICISLYNCLPMPRSRTDRRREYAIHFLSQFLPGYAREKPIQVDWLERISLFLKYNELLDYSHHYKYWDMGNLSERRIASLTELRSRIENQVPVVEFRPEDLYLLMYLAER